MANIKKERITQAAKRVNAKTGSFVKRGEGQLAGFLNFIRTQGAIGLAIGIVLGGAVGVMVKSLIDNIVMPPIGLLLGSADGIKGLSFTLGKAADGSQSVLHYGVFLNDLINFIIIALVVYLFVVTIKIDKWDKKKD